MTSRSGGAIGHGQVIRLSAVAAVFLLTIGAFASGVRTSGVDEMSSLSVFAWIYYAGGLFVFGGLDLGVPTGGSAIGRGALWVAFFLAPSITATAVIEAALRSQGQVQSQVAGRSRRRGWGRAPGPDIHSGDTSGRTG
jgi:hypothetical protein